MRFLSLILEEVQCFSRHLKCSLCAGRLDVFCIFIRCEEVDSNRLRPHLLRTSDYCWCDKDAMNHFAEVQYRTYISQMHGVMYIQARVVNKGCNPCNTCHGLVCFVDP